MNLQVVSPYRKCPFACPMCIAATDYQYPYEDLYKSNEADYILQLRNALHGFSGDVIITGDTEPTLFMDWVKKVIAHAELCGRKTELQTKNYAVDVSELKGLGTLAYSITNMKEYLRIPNLKTIKGNNRLVILLTKDFDCLDVGNFETYGFNQITFKCLQESDDPKTNEYIKANRIGNMDKIYQIMNDLALRGVSVRIDENCMEAEDRYRIFRTDGKIYDKWF